MAAGEPTLEPQAFEPITQQSEIQPAATVEEASVAPAIEQQAVEPIVQNPEVQPAATAQVQEPQTIDENNGFKSIDSLLNESQSTEPVVNNTVNTPIVEPQAPVNVTPQIQEQSGNSITGNVVVIKNVQPGQNGEKVEAPDPTQRSTKVSETAQDNMISSYSNNNSMEEQQQSPTMAPTMVLTPAA